MRKLGLWLMRTLARITLIGPYWTPWNRWRATCWCHDMLWHSEEERWRYGNWVIIHLMQTRSWPEPPRLAHHQAPCDQC